MFLKGLALALLAARVSAVPQILSFSCSPGLADARVRDVQVTCAVRVLDKEADIDHVYTRLVSPSGKFSLPLFFNAKKAFGITSYNGANFATTVTVPRMAEPGFWQIDYSGDVGFEMVNQKGSKVMVTDADATALNLQRFVKVYSPDDKAPPYLQDVVCASPVVVDTVAQSAGQVSCVFTVIDAGSGASSARATFIGPADPNNPTAQRALIHVNADVSSGLLSAKDNEYKLQAVAPAYAGMAGGNWTMLTQGAFAPYVEDKNLNGFSYEGVDAETLFSAPGFEVMSTVDTQPPQLQKFTCSATKVIVPAGGSDTYSCQLIIQDDLSGFKYGELTFDSPDRTASATLNFDANSRQVQFVRGGVFQPQITFDSNAAPGMWTATADGLRLYDYAGNVFTLTPDQLNAQSFPSYVLVTRSGTPDKQVETRSPAASVRVSYMTGLLCLLACLALRRATQ